MISREKFEALHDYVNRGEKIPLLVTREPFSMQVASLLELTPKNAIVYHLVLQLVKDEKDLNRLIQLFKYRNKIFDSLCKLKREKEKSEANNLLAENITAL